MTSPGLPHICMSTLSHTLHTLQCRRRIFQRRRRSSGPSEEVSLKTTEKMNKELKTHKLQIIDLKTQERETQEKLRSVSEQLDSAIERLTKREDKINRLQTTLTNQPQPPNINQLNQQLITKHKEEISNLTNIIE